MKAKIVFIALALFAGQAQAEWEYIGGADIFEVYVDKSTIRKQSGYTLAWVILDYFNPQKILRATSTDQLESSMLQNAESIKEVLNLLVSSAVVWVWAIKFHKHLLMNFIK